MLVQTGLIVQSLPLGMRFGQHMILSLTAGIFTKTTKKLPDQQQTYQNDRLFFGLTVAVVITMGLRATLSPSLQFVALAFFLSSIGATTAATWFLMPKKMFIDKTAINTHNKSIKFGIEAEKIPKKQSISNMNEETPRLDALKKKS